MAASGQMCDPSNPGTPIEMAWWMDTWYTWGMVWYYNTDQVIIDGYDYYYCSPSGYLYIYDPSVWGYFPGWTMAWAGYCNGDDPSDGLEWWQDMWYSWGMDFYENSYWNEGYLQYCYDGSQYTYNLDFWGGIQGWTMYYSGECNGYVPAD